MFRPNLGEQIKRFINWKQFITVRLLIYRHMIMPNGEKLKFANKGTAKFAVLFDLILY